MTESGSSIAQNTSDSVQSIPTGASRLSKDQTDSDNQHLKDVIKCMFVYSYVWGFGGNLSDRFVSSAASFSLQLCCTSISNALFNLIVPGLSLISMLRRRYTDVLIPYHFPELGQCMT